MGYLIIILLTGTSKGIQASVFYLISYFFTTLGAFGVITLLSTSDHESEKIEDFKGLFWKKPGIAIVFTLSLLSLAGIPLTAGFIAKFYVILEGINKGLMVLVFSLVINSVIGLYYYLRIITTLFSTASDAKFPELTLSGHITLAIIGISILVLGIYPGWLIDIIIKFVSL
jgi:NADH-quinone oxidoreductase subunit N